MNFSRGLYFVKREEGKSIYFCLLQRKSKVSDAITTMPLQLEDGWNHLQIDLQDMLKRVYGTSYKEAVSIQVHATCRLRRIYFTDKVLQEDELPTEFRLFVPES